MKETLTTLVVDDDDLLVKSLPSFLERVPGVDVIGTAYDGMDAIAQIKAKSPKMVVMDVRMPRMDGIEATKIIRKEYPDVCVVLMSGIEDPMMRAECMQSGAHAFMAKLEVNAQFPRLVETLFRAVA